MIDSILKKLGLSDKEIKVYKACLEAGPSSVRSIALSAGVNRGTTYDILKSLQKMGLVAYYHKAKHQYFAAEDPSVLRDALEQKQAQLEKTKEEIDAVIPQLRSMHKQEAKPVVKFYEGASGIKTILRDVIEQCSSGSGEYYVYSSPLIKKHLHKSYPNFSKDRIKAQVKVKSISIGPGGSTVGLDERKWLTDKQGSPTYTLLYEGRVAMVSVDAKGNAIGVMIEDKNIFETQKMLFEFNWNKL